MLESVRRNFVRALEPTKLDEKLKGELKQACYSSLFVEHFQSVLASIPRPADIMITHHELASYDFLDREANVKPTQ